MDFYKIKNAFYFLAFIVLVIITGLAILLLPIFIIGIIWEIFGITRSTWCDLFMASLIMSTISVILFMFVRVRY